MATTAAMAGAAWAAAQEMSATAWLAAVVVALATVLAVWGRRGVPNRPPMVRGWLPLVGHLHRLGGKTHEKLVEVGKETGSGVFEVFLGQMRHVVVTSAEGVQEVFFGPNARHFADRPWMPSIVYMSRGSMRNMVLGENNPWHQWVRKFTMQNMLSPNNLKDQFPLIEHARDRLLSELGFTAQQSAGSFDPTPVLDRAPMCLIYRVLFGEELPDLSDIDTTNGASSQDLGTWARQGLELTSAANPGDYIPLLNTLGINPCLPAMRTWRDGLDRYLLPHIRHHAATLRHDSPRDFIDHLLIYRDSPACSEEERANLDDDGIMCFAFGTFIAASDTVASTLGFFMCYAAENPEAVAKAQEEIANQVGNHRLVSLEDEDNLPYCRAVIKETLRLAAPVPINTRMTTEDTVLQGYTIPKGTAVMPHLYALHRDESVWGPDALEFKPERFLDDLQVTVGSPREQRWLPYGASHRLCLGYRLAQAELFLYITSIMQCFEVVSGRPGHKFSDNQVMGITIHPKEVDVFLKPRPAYRELIAGGPE